jgi:hypothetical protein
MIPAISLYADDVVLFCQSSPSDVATVRGILLMFSGASGLQVNYTKSSASLLRCDNKVAAPVIAQLGYPIVDLPIKYLGIPLTIRRPSAAQLQPVVDRIAGQLPAWKAKLMNKPGCLAFVKSVLGAMLPSLCTNYWSMHHQNNLSNRSLRFRKVFLGLEEQTPMEGTAMSTGIVSAAPSPMEAWVSKTLSVQAWHYG